MKNKLKKYNWLIFDADNTLFDYNNAEKSALLKTLDDYDIAYDKKSIIKTYHTINHTIWRDFEIGLIKSQDEIKQKRTMQLFDVLNVEADVNNFANDYLFNLSENNQLLDNAYAVIQALKKQHQMIIMTNGMTNVQRPRFKQSEITQFFSHIVISEEIKCAKPDAAIYQHAFELMHKPEKSQVLMIGDSLSSDIQGGINFGIDTLWYNPNKLTTKHNATYEFHDLMQLI